MQPLRVRAVTLANVCAYDSRDAYSAVPYYVSYACALKVRTTIVPTTGTSAPPVRSSLIPPSVENVAKIRH